MELEQVEMDQMDEYLYEMEIENELYNQYDMMYDDPWDDARDFYDNTQEYDFMDDGYWLNLRSTTRWIIWTIISSMIRWIIQKISQTSILGILMTGKKVVGLLGLLPELFPVVSERDKQTKKV